MTSHTAVTSETPLAVLKRARAAVAGDPTLTAHLAIGCDTAAEAVAGGARTRAWGLLLEPLYTDSVRDVASAYAAADAYCRISAYDTAPNQAGELEALDKAITQAEASLTGACT